MANVTNGFSKFMEEAGETGKAYMNMVMQQAQSSALDKKTHELAYISVLSAIRMNSGLDFHVKSAKDLGASRNEVKSAVLVGLPVVGITLTDALEAALKAYDEE
ncbi:alkylhydroperoxidase/carboxymuconolactone decarboxylase family protein YurZ [Hungatella effluvii]|uniref:Alkylhydroperoxidase/carboxymuconolactone decarboxylase family protein YurZ n=1 Tax=Hungatella effluvii TaxID=1096246 RepID=A0A2V3XYC8_9FIRM|nr:carboxymuconolactone decarboxylase family protein [Hungatella effluvii]PXX44571.1 alkylhydroperoxidase/carboxymuconolactone decarboxylase family protein YurZ [Hungatella effluvii]